MMIFLSFQAKEKLQLCANGGGSLSAAEDWVLPCGISLRTALGAGTQELGRETVN